MSVFAGLSGGLVGVVWGGLISSPWLGGVHRRSPGTLERETLARLATSTLLYGIGGAILGLLFFLGWGLIALVDAPWYAVGLLFGVLCWMGVALPTVGTLMLRIRAPLQVALVHGIEWLVVCVSAGLFCAYAWQSIA